MGVGAGVLAGEGYGCLLLPELEDTSDRSNAALLLP